MEERIADIIIMEKFNEDGIKPVYLKIVTKALSDTLLEYLLPQPVLSASTLLRSQSDDFKNIETAAENSEITEELIQHLNEDESDDAQLVVELKHIFYEFQRSSSTDHIKPDGKYDAQTISNALVQILSCNFLKDLSMEEAVKICTFMFEKKFISEKTQNLAVKKSNSYEICLEIMKNIKPRKPNWPFEFLDYIKGIGASKIAQEPKTEEVSPSPQEAAINIHPVEDDFKTEAMERLNNCPALSSKFSEYDSETFKKMKKTEQSHMTSFSDESGDDDSDDDDDEEASEQATVDLSLRNYQEELAQNALKGKNTIICAPTGSGKTRVATHVIIEHLTKQEAGNLKKKIAFLARTVPLVMQQFKGLKAFLPPKYQDKIESVTGDSEYSMSLHKIFPEYDVFVMTPRILENHVQGDDPLIPGGLAAFSLLIFDECHHTRKGEAYKTLMLSYLNTKEKSPHDLPQVVGLTASIGVEKANKISEAEESILKICSNLDAVCISTVKEHEVEMRQMVPVPEKAKPLKLKERSHDETVEKILNNIRELEKCILQCIKEIKNEELAHLIKKIPQDRKSQQYGEWVVKVEKKAMAIARQPQIETNSSIRSISVIADYLKAYNVALELYDLVPWRYVLDFLAKRFDHYQERKQNLTKAEQGYYSLFQGLQHLERDAKKGNRNLKMLKDVIKENLKISEEREAEDGRKIKVSKGIIFVRTRFIAHALTSWMEHNKDPALKNLGTSMFTGTDASEDEGGMTSTQQEEIIERFKSGDLRLLVATSVAEEGLDIPECNLVIKYNHVGNEVTTVQMRGRSRRKGGKSVLLAFESIFKKELINEHDAKMMEEAVKNVSFMSEEDIRKKNEKNQKDILKNDEIDKIMKQNAKSHLIDKDFKMVCKMCRQVVINSQDIKLIDDSHHVVANREFMDQIEKRRNKSLHVAGQMATYGYGICKGKPEAQAMCGNILGSLMIFNKISFIVLSVKSFGFEVEDVNELRFYNSWKKVPYLVKDIQTDDIQRYLPDTRTSPGKVLPKSEESVSEPTKNADFGNASEEKSEAQGNLNTTNALEESITHAKTVAQGSQLAAAASTTNKDSGFQSVRPKEKNKSSALHESNTYPKEMPAANLPELLPGMLSAQEHGTQELLQKAFNDTLLSKISSFLPPKSPEVLETPVSSIPSMQFSSSSEDDSEDER